MGYIKFNWEDLWKVCFRRSFDRTDFRNIWRPKRWTCGRALVLFWWTWEHHCRPAQPSTAAIYCRGIHAENLHKWACRWLFRHCVGPKQTSVTVYYDSLLLFLCVTMTLTHDTCMLIAGCSHDCQWWCSLESQTVDLHVRGLPWLRWSRGPKQQNYPALALSFNHRRQAFYNAFKEQPNHPQVQLGLRQGLRRARLLHKDTPDFIVEHLCAEHNLHHAGSGETPFGLVEKALKVEAMWKRKCSDEGITSRHPAYQQTYDSFVRANCWAFRENIAAFADAKSLGHVLEQRGVAKEIEARVWVSKAQSRTYTTEAVKLCWNHLGLSWHTFGAV